MTPRTADPDGRAHGVRVYGVLSAAHAGAAGRRVGTPAGLAAVELVRVRDLAAAVVPAPFAEVVPTTAELEATHTIIATLFAERAILPAPPGVVFRSREAVAAWLELHAAALAEALRYVEDRVEARLHATRAAPGSVLPGAATAAPVTEVLRTLRREAVAVLVLRDEGRGAALAGAARADDGPSAGERAASPALRAAFLVERARWGAFAGAVAREDHARPDLRLALTGPWPPYDFVRLDLGA